MANKYHVRSISLPSRSHPTTLKIERELFKLKSWEVSSSSTSRSILVGLSGLEDLYKCLDDLLKKATTQEIISHHQSDKCLDQLLDGSVKLLDVCSITRDLMIQFKEQVQALQSTLRRRKGDSSIESSIVNYACFRKKMEKDAKKLITTLKQMESKLEASSLLNDQDQRFSAVIRVLRGVNGMSSSIFQSLLLFLSATLSKTKQSKWSMVSKLLHKGEIACEEKQEIVNESESVDAALLIQKLDFENMQIVHKKLETLEMSIEDFENCLENVFRSLIKTRASILNIFSQ